MKIAATTYKFIYKLLYILQIDKRLCIRTPMVLYFKKKLNYHL